MSVYVIVKSDGVKAMRSIVFVVVYAQKFHGERTRSFRNRGLANAFARMTGGRVFERSARVHSAEIESAAWAAVANMLGGSV